MRLRDHGHTDRGAAHHHRVVRRSRRVHCAGRTPRPGDRQTTDRLVLPVARRRHHLVRRSSRQDPRRRNPRPVRRTRRARGRRRARGARRAADAGDAGALRRHIRPRRKRWDPDAHRHQHRRGPGRDAGGNRVHGDGRRRQHGIEIAERRPARRDPCWPHHLRTRLAGDPLRTCRRTRRPRPRAERQGLARSRGHRAARQPFSPRTKRAPGRPPTRTGHRQGRARSRQHRQPERAAGDLGRERCGQVAPRRRADRLLAQLHRRGRAGGRLRAVRRSERVVPDRQCVVPLSRSRSDVGCRRHSRDRSTSGNSVAGDRRRGRNRANRRRVRAHPRAPIEHRQVRRTRSSSVDPSHDLACARAPLARAAGRAVDQRSPLGRPGVDRLARTPRHLAQPMPIRVDHGDAPGQRRCLATAHRASHRRVVEPPAARPRGHRGACRATARRSMRRPQIAHGDVRAKWWQPAVPARARSPRGGRRRHPRASQFAARPDHRPP